MWLSGLLSILDGSNHGTLLDILGGIKLIEIIMTGLIVSLIVFLDRLESNIEEERRVKQDERKHYRTNLGNHFDDFG
jgi:hypothetical protein